MKIRSFSVRELETLRMHRALAACAALQLPTERWTGGLLLLSGGAYVQRSHTSFVHAAIRTWSSRFSGLDALAGMYAPQQNLDFPRQLAAMKLAEFTVVFKHNVLGDEEFFRDAAP